VTTVDNRERSVDVNEMAAFMGERGFVMDRGYGKIRGDMQPSSMAGVLAGLDTFLGR